MADSRKFSARTTMGKISSPTTRRSSPHYGDTSSSLQVRRGGAWHASGNLALQRALRARAGASPETDMATPNLASLKAPIFRRRLMVYPKLTSNASQNTYEQEAEQIAQGSRTGNESAQAPRAYSSHPTGTVDESSLGGKLLRRTLDATTNAGNPLPAATRESMESRLSADFGGVRVHADANAQRLAHSLGANAFTSGNDIYFNANRYDPVSAEGQRLLAHELTHVAQQGGQPSGPIQCDLMMSLPTALGGFEIEMATRGAPSTPGMEGHIRFLPDPTGPYSTQIGLIQVARVTDVAGASTTPGSPWDYSGSPEAGRMDLMTQGAGLAPRGWFVDAQTAAHARGSSVGPNYIEQWGITPPGSAHRNEFGWLRSPTDVKAASLYDYPSFAGEVDYEFETVAKATDTQAVYGALEWGFNIRSGVVGSEYAHAASAESATFDEALERFRGYYTHEPIVLYFDTDVDTPIAGEDTKILGVLGYLSRYPDVRVQIDGYADERGNPSHNLDLSMRRALNVERLCVALGIDPSRIDPPIGWGETTSFSAGSAARAAGSLRANRRVVVSFERTASTPITP